MVHPEAGPRRSRDDFIQALVEAEHAARAQHKDAKRRQKEATTRRATDAEMIAELSVGMFRV